MGKRQFRVLYREFLFRMVDLELLSPQADIANLLGQFAAVLIFLSAMSALGGLFFDASSVPPQILKGVLWGQAHSLIALTMVVVGVFAVLSWDSTFPNRRDVLVLAPLPVRSRIIFLAKVAALATSLGLTVVALNGLSGLAWSMNFIPANSGVAGLIRSLAAYWITVFAAGAFILCSVLGLQGLAAQLPRRRFLRLSSFLQLAAFSAFLIVYFLEPSWANPKALADPEHQRALAWLPSYWFLGLFEVLNGSPDRSALDPLARRALVGLAIAAFATGTAFLLSYFRTLRKIVEEPDIVPGTRFVNWMPRFGSSLETAVVLFSARTLLRSRQHRVILAAYLGFGLAIGTLYAQTPLARKQVYGGTASVPLLAASVLMLFAWMIGTRVVFSIPLELGANWIFRVTPIPNSAACLKAARRSLVVLSLVPAVTTAAAVFFSIWSWRPAMKHLIVLALLGTILADVCLRGFHKIPFTCSYLPGKSRPHLLLMSVWLLLLLTDQVAKFESRAFEDPARYAVMVAVLGLAAIGARWSTAALAGSSEGTVRFEETEQPAIAVLGLCRDGRVST